MVGASAFVGALTTPPPADVAPIHVQLTAAAITSPTPNTLYAALIETGEPHEADMNGIMLGSAAGVPTAFPSPFSALAATLGFGLHLWDTAVGVGAAVVAGVALTPGLIGVGLSTPLINGVATSLELLVESGVMPAPLAGAIAALLSGVTDAAIIGVGGFGTGIAWKAALDAALANAIAPAGADIISALIGDFPNIDLTAAVSAVIGGLAAMGETLLTWWDATVTLGSSVVAGIAMTTATSLIHLHTALTEAFLETLTLLAHSGLLPASAATALAGAVEWFSSAANAGILGLGSAVAWTAALPAAVAHAIATEGIGLIDAIAGHFPNVPDYPVFDLAALKAQLEENFPDFPLLPPVDFADLEPAAFLTLLEAVFPGVELSDLEFPDFDLAALIALLHGKIPDCNFGDSEDADVIDQLSILPEADVSVSSEDEQPPLVEEANIEEVELANSSDGLGDSGDSRKDFRPAEAPSPMDDPQKSANSPQAAAPDASGNNIRQPAQQSTADDSATRDASAPKHASAGEPDEASLLRNASSTPPKHAVNAAPTHDLHGVRVAHATGTNSQTPESRSSESLQRSESPERRSAPTSESRSDRSTKKQTSDSSESGPNSKSGDDE